VFLTDAQPTHSDLDGQGLKYMTQASAGHGVQYNSSWPQLRSGLLIIALSRRCMQLFTTFIGVGVDFNSELIEEIVKVRGANYFAVHSVPEFKERMNEVRSPTSLPFTLLRESSCTIHLTKR